MECWPIVRGLHGVPTAARGSSSRDRSPLISRAARLTAHHAMRPPTTCAEFSPSVAATLAVTPFF